jgi:CBS domain-containing protein
VRDVMSEQPSCCSPETELDEVEQTMSARQVRRVPVVDRHGCCVGMVAQADLARRRDADDVGHVVGDVSQPTGGPRV